MRRWNEAGRLWLLPLVVVASTWIFPILWTAITSLKPEGGRPVFSTNEQRSSKELGGAKGGFGYTARVPLKELHAEGRLQSPDVMADRTRGEMQLLGGVREVLVSGRGRSPCRASASRMSGR